MSELSDYIVKLSLEGKVYNTSNRGISFSLKDSIYHLACNSLISIFDVQGLVQESLFLTQGTVFDLEYGRNEDVSNRNTYRIVKEDLEKVEVVGTLGGTVDYTIRPSWQYEKGIKSKGYRGRIDTVLTHILNSYPSIKLDIDENETLVNKTFYQPLINDYDFIEQQLTPFAYSSTTRDTPFYIFMTVDGVLHFKSLQTMLDKAPVATYHIRVPQYEHRVSEDFYTTVMSAKRWKEDIKHHLKDVRYYDFHMDRTTGTFKESKKTILNHGLKSYDQHVPIELQNSEVYGYKNHIFNYDDLTEGFQGVRNSQQKDSMMFDRFFLLVPENPSLRSGETINLKVDFQNEVGASPSKTWTDKYLIEETEHIWDEKSRQGYTKIIVGRRFAKIESDILKTKKLFKG